MSRPASARSGGDVERAALQTARVAGVATSLIGTALVLAPRRAGALGGVPDPREARWIGVADLVLAPGLLAGRPVWPWLAARSGLNLVQAAVVARHGRRGRLTAVSLLFLSAADGRAAAQLRRARR